MKYMTSGYQLSNQKKWLPYLLIGALLVAVVGAVLGVRWWYIDSLKAVNPQDNNPVLVRINDGASTQEIADSLHKQGVIKNALAIRIYFRLQGVSGDIQAGLYRFMPSEDVAEITQRLISGDTAVHSVTITPGMNIFQVIQRLEQTGYQRADIEAAMRRPYPYSILADKPPEATLEGYLYPETYIVELDTPVEEMISQMLSVTDKTVTPKIRQEWAHHGLNLHQGLTLASIVQKEVNNPEDQRKVAQVFLKRLAIGMKLEADPTFQYGALLLGQEASVGIDSPYNTYLITGLPPGPIANPDLEAMEAVANPAATDFLYFLSDSEGNTHFTDTLEKHKQNIEEYLQ